MLNWLLSAPSSCHKYFCRYASRQSVYEGYSALRILRQFIGLKVEKQTNGTCTVATMAILSIKMISRLNINIFYARLLSDAYEKTLCRSMVFENRRSPIGSIISTLEVGEIISFINDR